MKRLRFSWKYALVITGLIFLAYLVMDFNNRIAVLRRLTVQRDLVEVKVTSLERTQVLLRTQIAYATSDQSVVDWAYEDGHMVRPGDNPVVIISSPGGTPVPVPKPVIRQLEVSNWQVWLWLFVDERAP